MDIETRVVGAGLVLAALAGLLWYARQYDRQQAKYNKVLDRWECLSKESSGLPIGMKSGIATDPREIRF